MNGLQSCGYLNQAVFVVGFAGDECKIDVNECSSQPCQHGGICTEPLINMHVCTCAAGYSGATCEHDLNECVSQPCPSYQVCVNLVNGYRSVCLTFTHSLLHVKTLSIQRNLHILG